MEIIYFHFEHHEIDSRTVYLEFGLRFKMMIDELKSVSAISKVSSDMTSTLAY